MDETLFPGKKCGRWTLLEERKESKWLCICDCGTQREVLARSLRYGGSTSCGCLRKERKDRDLTGRTFGELTVVKSLENSAKTGKRWLCRCSCGEEYEVLGTLLTTGRRTHCSGKAHRKNYAYTDITGQKFGRLTALHPAQNQTGNNVIWHCRCDCGKEIDLSYNVLLYTTQKSCGCQKKEHDQKLQTFLTHVAGTSVDMLKSKKIPKDNTTGCKGVYYIRGKYVAKIVFQKKSYYLGNFDRISDAVQARKEAEQTLFDSVAAHYEKWKEIAGKNPTWAEENPIQVIVTQNADKSLAVKLLPDIMK